MRALIERVHRLQRLAVFEAAARLGSFTAAASELSMTQPGVTRHIRALESALGVELFERRSNRVVLNRTGQQLHESVGQGFAVIESGLAQLGDDPDTFILAANPGVAQRWLVPHLEALRQALGDRDLRLWLFEHDAELAGGRFDAAIHAGSGEWPGTESLRLFPEIVLPVATPAVATRLGLDGSSRAEALIDKELLYLDDTDRSWMSWRDWFVQQGVDLPSRSRRVTYSNYAMVLEQAMAGRGIALAWRYLIDDLLERQLLTPVGPEVHRPTAGYYLLWPRGRRTGGVGRLSTWLDGRIGR